jgi:hypothetical protein
MGVASPVSAGVSTVPPYQPGYNPPMASYEEYLRRRRPSPVHLARVQRSNPAADELAADINRHLANVEAWINGHRSDAKILAAMEFFDLMFPGQYDAPDGRLLYRGQAQPTFDGSPRSYSYDRAVAEAFAVNSADECETYLVKRKVCRSCADRQAFRLSLDLGRLMAKYALNKFAIEREVIILNTVPKGSAATVQQYQLCQA